MFDFKSASIDEACIFIILFDQLTLIIVFRHISMHSFFKNDVLNLMKNFIPACLMNLKLGLLYSKGMMINRNRKPLKYRNI